MTAENSPSNKPPSPWEERKQTVRETRIESVYAAWIDLTDGLGGLDIRLSNTRIAEAIENYLNDIQALLMRHRINGLIQHHKIAGLIAANLLKNPPIIPLDEERPLQREFYDNQIFALRHALSIVFQEYPDGIAKLEASPGYRGWFRRTVDFMKRRPDCGEALVAMFDAIASIYIPDELRKGGD